MKRVLLLNSSHNDLGLIRALKKLGFYIVATGKFENSSGEQFVDKKIRVDYSDKDLILKIAKEENVDNVCPCCNDLGVYTAAFVAEKLGIPGYDSYDTTLLLHNKDKFKAFAKQYGIQTPKANVYLEAESAISALKDTTFPVIVKPVDCSAGIGISVVRNASDYERAIELAFSKSRARRIVIEEYITGSQHGFCTFLLNEKVVAFASNDEISILNPFRVEIDTFPATEWEKSYKFLIEQIEKIAKTLKLKDGIFHLQYILKDGKPWIIEVMRRTVGNMYHVLSNPLNGFEWEYWEARARCGLDCSNFPMKMMQEGNYAYKTILAKENGMVKSIVIPENYKKYIFDEFYLKKIGDRITNFKSEPVGFLFMMFSSKDEMKRVLIDEYSCDLVETD